jgi:prepilin-type N-terminal cleavage/methylation domain-containing protein
MLISPLRHGFTFTEILIALALIVVLLIGVSQVFNVTGETISRSQAFSGAMRVQRAVQQTLATDILGVDPDASSNGFVPMQVTNGSVPSGSRQPFLIISNFRVPTFLNARDEREDIDRPQTNDNFATRSDAVRSIDLDGNQSIDGGPEYLSIYDLGLRNFRTDTITFFSRGQFSRQLSETGNSPSQFTSGEAMIHYGHLRLFNGEIGSRFDSQVYGAPGYTQTTSGRPNRNNLYAEQFALGRVQMLLREPNAPTGPSSLAVRDDSGRVPFFVRRSWDVPTNVTGANNNFTPFGITFSEVWGPASTPSQTPVVAVRDGPGNTQVHLGDMRTDVIGVSLSTAEARMAARTAQTNTWFGEFSGVTHTSRFQADINPPRPFTASNLAQRHHVLAESATQFIVEFAGDFFVQNASGQIQGIVEPGVTDWVNPPDGVDYRVDPDTARRSIRWYGMPRDENGDGIIGGSLQPHFVRDVLPVRDFAARAGVDFSTPRPSFPFERSLPTLVTDYASVRSEPGTSPDASSYVCAWGPYEMADNAGVRPATYPNTFFAGVPSLVRITVEIRDPNNRLAEPVVQQYVFPLRR